MGKGVQKTYSKTEVLNQCVWGQRTLLDLRKATGFSPKSIIYAKFCSLLHRWLDLSDQISCLFPCLGFKNYSFYTFGAYVGPLLEMLGHHISSSSNEGYQKTISELVKDQLNRMLQG